MRILLIRHGDPDYVNDTLTEKGHREAALLAEAAPDMNLGTCFVSPLGRAQDTAAYSLDKTGLTAETLDWLEEFPARVDLNEHPGFSDAYQNVRMKDGKYVPRVVWDMVPAYWTEHPEYFDREKWRESEITCYTNVIEKYDWVTGGLDAFLASGGYGALLCWIHYFFRSSFDKIDPVVTIQLREAVEERILAPYMNNDGMWWMAFRWKPGQIINNWNPWCNSDVLQCFLLMENDKERLSKAVYRTMRFCEGGRSLRGRAFLLAACRG